MSFVVFCLCLEGFVVIAVVLKVGSHFVVHVGLMEINFLSTRIVVYMPPCLSPS